MVTSLAAGRLRGRQKAATLLIALGPELSAQVLKHLKEADIELLTLEVFSMEKVSEEVKDTVLEECFQMAVARDFLTSGGAEYARQMLGQALGPTRAEEMLSRLAEVRRPRAFDFVRETDPVQLAGFIQGENPQTIALVLAHMPPKQAAATLSTLPTDLQHEVALRVATMDRTPPDVVDQVEQVLKRRMSSVITSDYTRVGGVECLVKVLTNVDRGTEKYILENMEELEPDLAQDVRKLMFVFEDITALDDRSLQRVLREVDSRDLALALKGASDELKNKVFRNQSVRAAESLREEMEVSGPVRLRQVEEAQQRIVAIVRRLDEAEEIVILRGGEDVLV